MPGRAWPPLRGGVVVVECGGDPGCLAEACRGRSVVVRAAAEALWGAAESLPPGCVVLVESGRCGGGAGCGGGGV